MNNLEKLIEYAKNNGIGYDSIKANAREGKLKTAKKIGKTWYAELEELNKFYENYSNLPSDDYIVLEEYAKLYGIVLMTLQVDVKNKRYKTAIKHKKRWYIDKNEKPQQAGYLTVSEFAKLHHKTSSDIRKLINKGLLKALKFNSDNRFFIAESEEFIDYISINKYANLNDVPYYIILIDIHNNVYNTAVNQNGRWYLDREEPCKSQKFMRIRNK